MRVFFVWCALSTLWAALGSGESALVLSAPQAAAVGALLAVVTALGSGASRVLVRLRRGEISVVDDARPYRPWAGLGPAVTGAAVGGAAAAALVSLVVVRPFFVLAVAGGAGAAATLWSTPPTTVKAVGRRLWPWLWSGAVVAGLMAGLVGVVVGAVRLGTVPRVAPDELARVLAATSLTYTLLGVGGFMKALHEVRARVIVVDGGPVVGPPGPFLLGLLLSAACALVGPFVLPSLPGEDVVVVKGSFGLVVGMFLSLLGAMAGHRVAVWGRAGVPPSLSASAPTVPSPRPSTPGP